MVPVSGQRGPAPGWIECLDRVFCLHTGHCSQRYEIVTTVLATFDSHPLSHSGTLLAAEAG
jgi:hypothetical protein